MKINQFFLTVFIIFLTVSQSHAGVTIHYEGYAHSPAAVNKIITIAKTFASKQGWVVDDASANPGILERVINEENKDYAGKVTGIMIYTDKKCEPLHFQFGDDLFMQDFVKTQFAGPDTHIAIVELLTELKIYFRVIEVIDEGEYWETHDRDKLEKHISTVNKLIEEMKSKNVGIKGPIILPTGRIVDIME